MTIQDFGVEPIVRRELQAGEPLLWSGQPGQGIRVRRADAFAIPFSIMWAGFWVFWEANAIREGTSLFMELWGVPFLVVGSYLVAGRFIVDTRRRRHTLYGVTDRRVIVISGLFSSSATSHAFRALPSITLAERGNGEGDIVLAATDMSHVAIGGIVSRGSSVPPALEFLPHVRHVYEIVRAAPGGNLSSNDAQNAGCYLLPARRAGDARGPRCQRRAAPIGVAFRRR